ncbi:unnamed protein product [Fusarium langsethiae]|nr:unnamed protein product [Fusarium langsethiae]
MTRIRQIWNSQLQTPEGMTDVQLGHPEFLSSEQCLLRTQVTPVLFYPPFFHVRSPKCTFPALYCLVRPELASQLPASLVENGKFDVTAIDHDVQTALEMEYPAHTLCQ